MLPEELREKLARQLEAVGYERADSDGSVTLRGKDWHLSLVGPSSDRTGLVGIELSTNREKEGSPIVRFGSRSVLVFGAGRTATWSFL